MFPVYLPSEGKLFGRRPAGKAGEAVLQKQFRDPAVKFLYFISSHTRPALQDEGKHPFQLTGGPGSRLL